MISVFCMSPNRIALLRFSFISSFFVIAVILFRFVFAELMIVDCYVILRARVGTVSRLVLIPHQNTEDKFAKEER